MPQIRHPYNKYKRMQIQKRKLNNLFLLAQKFHGYKDNGAWIKDENGRVPWYLHSQEKVHVHIFRSYRSKRWKFIKHRSSKITRMYNVFISGKGSAYKKLYDMKWAYS